MGTASSELVEQHLLLEMQKQNLTYQPVFLSTCFCGEAVPETFQEVPVWLAGMSREWVITQQLKGRPVQEVAEGLSAFTWLAFPGVPALLFFWAQTSQAWSMVSPADLAPRKRAEF